MTEIQPGNYIIVSALGDDLNLQVTEITHPQPFPVKAVQTTLRDVWQVEKVKDNEFRLSRLPIPGLKLFVEDGKAWGGSGRETTFSIESTGEGKWRIHIPATDLVLKLPAADKQVITAPWDGDATEQWVFQTSE